MKHRLVCLQELTKSLSERSSIFLDNFHVGTKGVPTKIEHPESLIFDQSLKEGIGSHTRNVVPTQVELLEGQVGANQLSKRRRNVIGKFVV